MADLVPTCVLWVLICAPPLFPVKRILALHQNHYTISRSRSRLLEVFAYSARECVCWDAQETGMETLRKSGVTDKKALTLLSPGWIGILFCCFCSKSKVNSKQRN